MKTEQKTAKQRKFLLVLPMIVFPFLTMFFWSLGGGKASEMADNTDKSTLNPLLPGSGQDEGAKDKLSYYELAAQDSARFAELSQRDTNYRHPGLDSPYFDADFYNDPMYGNSYGNQRTADEIYRNLSRLERQMNNPYAGGGYGYDGYPSSGSYGYNSASEMKDIEQMMMAMNQASQPDPEMEQINSMLDKLMEIQNPNLANERMKELSAKRRGEVFAVTGSPAGEQVSLLDQNGADGAESGFFSLDDKDFSEGLQNAVRAVIHEDQTIVNGSTVKLRLVNDIYVGETKIPKDNFVFGVAQLSGERLGIKIESIRYGNSLFPVELTVYDLDGLDGIYIPGSITRDVVKESADRPMQAVSLGALDASWGAQAAGAGVEIVKGLFSKKAKLIKVKVKAGYRLLLRDEKQKDL
ncbi:MAG: conjugative transposon protein TraM [Flavobacteriia bacterium]|nr:conjugative transposon protein TraM [Flavobacteriia bacterium]OJX37168.1 MAG: conjugative transposon protein TraM [Flavobacteriia bacterium 40-80]